MSTHSHCVLKAARRPWTYVHCAGLPAVLRALLCLIECTSTSFRSVSLSLRVTANSAAAHVLLNTLIDMSYASICMMALVIHMIMWTNRFAWHNFRIPRFGVCNLISGFGYHLIQPLEARIRGIHYMHNTLWFRERRVGSAVRRLSRHQLYKHVNAHVYLGVLAYYAK